MSYTVAYFGAESWIHCQRTVNDEENHFSALPLRPVIEKNEITKVPTSSSNCDFLFSIAIAIHAYAWVARPAYKMLHSRYQIAIHAYAWVASSTST